MAMIGLLSFILLAFTVPRLDRRVGNAIYAEYDLIDDARPGLGDVGTATPAAS